MMLRRVMEHVRRQDWAAVAIDFVITVVGVFVGLQAANLNEDRIDWRFDFIQHVRVAEHDEKRNAFVSGPRDAEALTPGGAESLRTVTLLPTNEPP